jgi:DNA-binding transcriptional regulator YhcF (GntR family)
MSQRLANQMFTILASAADNGSECPSIISVAAMMGHISATTTSRVFCGLEASGRIIIDRSCKPFVVTIKATGRSTARRPIKARVHLNRQAEMRADGARRGLAIAAEEKAIIAAVALAQSTRLAERERWLTIEQEKYGLPKRARLIDGMGA